MGIDFNWSPVKKARARDLELRLQVDAAKSARAAIGDTAGLEKRALNDDEREQFFKIMPTQIKALEKELMENSAAILAAEEQEQADMNDTTAGNNADMNASRAAVARAGISTVVPSSVSALGSKPTGRTFAAMFGAAAMSADGWTSPEEYLAMLHSGRSDTRLRASFMPSMNAQATGTVGADGGYSVPTQFSAEWLDASLETEIVRSRAKIWPMTSDTRRIPGWDASDSTSNLYGAFTAQWVEQAGEITAETPKLRSIQLSARKLALLTQVANELLADGLGYNEQLGRAIVSAIGWHLDEAFLNGAGAPGPQGVIGSDATITVARGQANTILYSDLTSMFSRVHPASIANSVWVANPATIPQITALSVVIGTAGSHVPVMTQNDGRFFILTREVVFSEKVPNLGTAGDIGIYDFSQYSIGLRADMSLERSGHVGFTNDTSYFRGLLRADGQSSWAEPYTPKNGPTLSPFVVLGDPA